MGLLTLCYEPVFLLLEHMASRYGDVVLGRFLRAGSRCEWRTPLVLLLLVVRPGRACRAFCWSQGGVLLRRPSTDLGLGGARLVAELVVRLRPVDWPLSRLEEEAQGLLTRSVLETSARPCSA